MLKNRLGIDSILWQLRITKGVQNRNLVIYKIQLSATCPIGLTAQLLPNIYSLHKNWFHIHCNVVNLPSTPFIVTATKIAMPRNTILAAILTSKYCFKRNKYKFCSVCCSFFQKMLPLVKMRTHCDNDLCPTCLYTLHVLIDVNKLTCAVNAA